MFSYVPGGAVGFLLVVNLLIFILGFFIDFFEIAFILLPLLGPVAAKMGIDLVWFAVMIGVNMQTSFLTPPFGFALFYLRSCAPKEVKTADIYRGVIPFVGVQLVALALVVGFPQLVTGMTVSGLSKSKDASKIEINIPPPESADPAAGQDTGEKPEAQVPTPETPSTESASPSRCFQFACGPKARNRQYKANGKRAMMWNFPVCPAWILEMKFVLSM
jgi:hypothetical protein